MFSFVWMLGTMTAVTRYVLPWIENRPGLVQMRDPILERLTPRDWSWFLSISTSILTVNTCVAAAYFPWSITTRMLWAISSVQTWRMISMTLSPLKAPKGCIPMPDKMVDAWGHMFNASAPSVPYLNDVFFSGHTATSLILLQYVLAGCWYESHGSYLLLVTPCFCIVAVPLALLSQAVHYSFDVLVGYVASFMCWYSPVPSLAVALVHSAALISIYQYDKTDGSSHNAFNE